MLRIVYACVALLLLAPQSWAQDKKLVIDEKSIKTKVGGFELNASYENLDAAEVESITIAVRRPEEADNKWVAAGFITTNFMNGQLFLKTNKTLDKGKWVVHLSYKVSGKVNEFGVSVLAYTVDLPGGVEAPPPGDLPPPLPPPSRNLKSMFKLSLQTSKLGSTRLQVNCWDGT